jgi:hypothetical protein
VWGGQPPRHRHTRALNVGTELGRIYVRKTGPHPEIDIEGTIDAKLAVNDQFRLDQWWATSCQVIGDLLSRLSKPPFPWDTTIAWWAYPPPRLHVGSPPNRPQSPQS